MNHINHRIYLDIHSMGPLVSVRCKLGDTARSISATLTDKCAPYRIPETCIAVFTAKKPDGTILYNDCAISGNTVIYPFTPQTACCAGTLDCEFRLYDGEDILLVSPRFHLIVEDTVYQDGDIIESASEVSALTGLMSDAAEMMRDFQSRLENGGFVGPQGEKGEKGDPGFTWKGVWQSSKQYYVGDVVYHNGSSYIVTADSLYGEEPFEGAGCYAPLTRGLHWRGNWIPAETYELNDVVFYEGATYVCLGATAHCVPGEEETVWSMLAQKGENGRNGTDGKTPVKGIDYFTEADKAEMVNKVIAALPVYNGEVI